MPNGDREPYRIGEGCPSPVHTSDSEKTYDNKHRWHMLAFRYWHKWRRFVIRQRRRRTAGFLQRVLRKKIILSDELAGMLASWLVG